MNRFAGLVLIVLTAGSIARAQTVLNLGSAANYGVLGGTSITSTGATVINGDLGLSPGTSVTGFAAVLPGGLGIVNGSIDIANGAAAQAETDLGSAYSTAAGFTATVPGTMTLNNVTLAPGVYNSPSTLAVSGVITLDGQNESNPTFVFQMGSTLTVAAGTQILLINGATMNDVTWQVGTTATLGENSSFAGDILASTSINLDSDIIDDGRLLAMTGTVTMSSDVISAVPEPAETCLIMGGCAAIFAAGWRRRRTDLGRGVSIR